MSFNTNNYDANEESDRHTLDMIGYRVDEILDLSRRFCNESSKDKAKQIIARLDNI